MRSNAAKSQLRAKSNDLLVKKIVSSHLQRNDEVMLNKPKPVYLLFLTMKLIDIQPDSLWTIMKWKKLVAFGDMEFLF